MARYRIGNDMTILWTVNGRDGSALPLKDKEVHLYYTCERGRFEANFEIQGTNVVAWNFLGKNQRALGDYTLSLEILQSDGKRTIKMDKCNAFSLVGRNCEELYDNADADINEGGELTIVSNLDIYRISPIIPYVVKDNNGIGYWYVDGVETGDRSTGESAYEYALTKGFDGTEEEFAALTAKLPNVSAELAKLSEEIESEVDSILSVEDIEAFSYEPIDKVYASSGELTEYTRGYHTPPIKVNKGDIVSSPKIYPIGSFISQVTEDGTWIKRLDKVGTPSYIKYSQAILEDGYISISYYLTSGNTNFIPTIVIKRANKFIKELDEVRSDVELSFPSSIKITDKEGFILLENKYVNIKGELITPTNTKVNTYKIPTELLKNIDVLYVESYLNTSSEMAIAFYTGEPSVATYMSSSSIRAVGGYGEYSVIVPIAAKYACVPYNVSNAEAKIIGYINSKKDTNYDNISKRESNVVDTTINERIDISSYDDGTQFRLKFGNISNGGVVYLKNPQGVIFHGINIKQGQSDIYFEKTKNLSEVQIYKSASTGNNIEYELMVIYHPILSKRIQGSYIYKGNAETLNMGEAFIGYWITPNSKNSDDAWCCYPIQYSNGYNVKISCVDFSVYYVALKMWRTDLSGYVEMRITEEAVIDLSGIIAWHIQFRRIDRASLDLEKEKNTISVEYVSGEIWERPSTKHEVDEIAIKVDEIAIKVDEIGGTTVNLAFNPFRNNPYYAHYASNGFIKDGLGNKAIASESLEDVEMAARLGFGFIEANIHMNASSDFVCIHGNTGSSPVTFGNEVIDISNGNLGSDIAISETTTEYMDANIRYNSQIEKYKTKVPTLERFLKACKENNIGIFAGTSNKKAIDMCVQYLGKDNVVVYSPPSDIRDYFNGYLFSWNNSASTSADSLISQADRYGVPYMCGIGPSLLAQMKTDDVLDSFIKRMHEKGYLVGIAAVYQTEADVRDCFKRGMDFAAAGHEVNPFSHNYECFDLDGDSSQFNTTGTISDNIVRLTDGQILECGSTDTIPIGKAYLTMRFVGTITANFGSVGSRTITSDGSENVVVTDYFLRNNTHLIIRASGDVTIASLVYKTSKC